MVVLVVVVAVLLVVAQPPAMQASQQLVALLTQVVTRLGLRHVVALLLMEHLVLPSRVVRQQVTKPGLPQVERDAHLLTNRAQLLFTRTVFLWRAAQLT